MNLVLASASERRIELLKRITKEFKIAVSNFDENSIPFEDNIPEYVMAIARGKAETAAKIIEIQEREQTLIVGCDTVVSFKNMILGKPKSKEEAFEVLKALSGNTHKVYTGIAILDLNGQQMKKDYVCTEVRFSHISDDMIKRYVESGDCMDKAGSYGIQGDAAIFVEEINGCFYNVVGLPLNKLHKMLLEMGVNL